MKIPIDKDVCLYFTVNRQLYFFLINTNIQQLVILRKITFKELELIYAVLTKIKKFEDIIKLINNLKSKHLVETTKKIQDTDFISLLTDNKQNIKSLEFKK